MNRLDAARAGSPYRLQPDQLRGFAELAAAAGWRFVTLIADQPEPPAIRLDYVFVAPETRAPVILRLDHAGGPRSIALAHPAASWAEREVSDQYGVVFADSPDARPLLHHEDWPAGVHPLRDATTPPIERVPGTYAYDHVDGEGVMEIRVGPIHAGIIEPGHFRFSTIGETVLSLEIRLGYVHRGVELAARGKAPAAALALAERISGTASVAHAVALARALEAALDVSVPAAHALYRSFLVELERLYNHLGDLGNLCAGTALAGVLAEGLIVKESLLEAAARLTGSRYLRGAIALGGTRRIPSRDALAAAFAAAERAAADGERLAAKMFESATNLERLTGTGILAIEHARALATVGVVARGSGLATDSRRDLDFPSEIDRLLHRELEIATDAAGDVAARARVRLAETRSSLGLLRAIVARLATEPVTPAGAPSRAGGEALGWCEGPRGEIVTFARVVDGRLARLRVRSPSRVNWRAIEQAMPGNIVPDFPLINKSFNLSYAGADL